MAKQRVMLEHETDFTITCVQAAHVGAVEANMPAGLMLQPGDNAQQRGFPGTGRPQQYADLAFFYAETDALEHLGLIIPCSERFAELLNL